MNVRTQLTQNGVKSRYTMFVVADGTYRRAAKGDIQPQVEPDG